jgi:membrane-associated phospholipid phosphatase
LLAQTSLETPLPEDARDRVFYPGDTESLKPLGRKLARNIWLDQKEIWASPFRAKKKNAKLWIGFGAATAALVATDRRTSKTFENSTGQIRWANRVSNIGRTYTVLPVIAGFYGIGVLEDKPKLRETGVLSAEAVIDSLLVVEILKPVVGRNRPNSRIERGNFFDDGGDSFPSGHSISSWALASVISHEYSRTKWVPFVAYGLAGTVRAAR